MSKPDAEPDYLSGNRNVWQGYAADYVEAAEENWAAADPVWGIWGIPERTVGMMPDDARGLDTVELGCGTAYVSAWLKRAGAKPVGVDPTPNQLATARSMMRKHGLEFPLVECGAESLPFPDRSFDFAISEYGAALWSDPYLWIPEAARVLRPGGTLRFLSNAPLLALTLPENESDPVGTTLLRPYLGMHKVVYADTPEATEFHLPHGEMIALLHDAGFDIEWLKELGAPEGASTRYSWADPDWAARWPTEDVWSARRR